MTKIKSVEINMFDFKQGEATTKIHNVKSSVFLDDVVYLYLEPVNNRDAPRKTVISIKLYEKRNGKNNNKK